MKLEIKEALFEGEVVGLQVHSGERVYHVVRETVRTGRVIFPDEGKMENKERVPSGGELRTIATYEDGKLSKKRVR